MAEIDGAFSGVSSSNVRPYLVWSYSQNIAGNYSDVTAELYFQKLNGAYYGYNLTNSANANNNINGDNNNSNVTFDLRSQSTQFIRGRTVRVYHNNDGTKSCYVGFDGDTQISWGTFNFGQNINLPQIPRQSNITSSVDFTIGNNISFNIYNPGNNFVRAELWVSSTFIFNTNFTQTSSATIIPSGANNNTMYALLANATSSSMFVRLYTYSDAGYSQQIGSNSDYGGTVSVNQATNAPIFSTFGIANVDKSIVVQDIYSNTLITSSTTTLLGSNTKMIQGYSKLRATVLAANKMVTQNSATPIKYRFVDAGQQTESAYSTSDVTIDIDNATFISATVSAYDSRSLVTSVSNSMAYLANYSPILIYGLTLTRDNSVDPLTKLSFNGNLWNQYFGGGTSGVQNTCVIQYRWKYTTDTWASQSWTTITPSIDGSGVITYNSYVNGDLGASGFDGSKSFSIQLRAYDALTQMLIENILNVGIPLMDFTQKAVAINQKVDSSDTSILQLNGSITIDKLTTTPNDPTTSNETKMYMKGTKIIFKYNDGGTIQYKYLDLSGTVTTWVQTTTAP